MDKKAMKKMFFSNKMAVVCSALILLIVLVAILAPLSPYDPDASSVAEKMQGISSAHILGTWTTLEETHLHVHYMVEECH